MQHFVDRLTDMGLCQGICEPDLAVAAFPTEDQWFSQWFGALWSKHLKLLAFWLLQALRRVQP
jgi:hypothetical protein